MNFKTSANGTYHEPKAPHIEEAQSSGMGYRGGERQALQSPKLSRISHTVSGELDELATDLNSKVLGSVRIKKRLMRSHYLDDFVRQEVTMGAELVNGSELQRALALLITRHSRAGYRHSRAARIQHDKVAQNIPCELTLSSSSSV